MKQWSELLDTNNIQSHKESNRSKVNMDAHMKVQRMQHTQPKSTSRDYSRQFKNISTTIIIKNKIQFRFRQGRGYM